MRDHVGASPGGRRAGGGRDGGCGPREPAACAPPVPGLAFALALALALGPGSAGAQESLASVAASVARAWTAGDVPALAGRMMADGVEFHLGTEAHPHLGVRQVRAALDRLLSERGPGRAVVGRVEALEGQPREGFAELRWTPAEPAGSAAGYDMFVGFRELEGRWRITEIRVLR